MKFVEQTRFIQQQVRRATPEQRLPGRADAPTVRVTLHQPHRQGFRASTLAQFEQAGDPRQLRLEPQLPGLVHQARGIAGATQQQGQQVVAALPPPLLLHLQMTLGQEHLGGHPHQFGVGPQLLRLAGDAEHADQPAVEHQRQIDAGLHALQALCCFTVDLDDALVGQHQLRAFVAGVDALGFAAAKDQALAVHDIDVVGQDGHRPIDDILRQVMVQFEHAGFLEGLRVGLRRRYMALVHGTATRRKCCAKAQRQGFRAGRDSSAAPALMREAAQP